MLPKYRRVKKRKNFSEIFSNRLYINGKSFRIYYKFYSKTNLETEVSDLNKHFPRFAVVTSKKIGNAVTRNKYRRRIFEIIRNHPIYGSQLRADIVIMTYPGIIELSRSEIKKEISDALDKLILKNI